MNWKDWIGKPEDIVKELAVCLRTAEIVAGFSSTSMELFLDATNKALAKDKHNPDAMLC